MPRKKKPTSQELREDLIKSLKSLKGFVEHADWDSIELHLIHSIEDEQVEELSHYVEDYIIPLLTEE
jgi:inhibitor of KinA sporulation pathway (predicted exonuclease)